MNPSIANNIINDYAYKEGFPTIKELHLMEHDDFLRELELWSTDYIEALPDAGLYYKLEGEIQDPTTGQMIRSEWGWKMEQVRKAVEFRNTTEGKKHVLSFLISEPIRNEETDENDKLNTASITVSATTGSVKKDKKQTKINIKRMEHIRALEKSIFKGGGLRTMYEASLKAHKNNVENLMTNEDAAKAAMKSKRRKMIPALLLSWFVMPLYVIFRSFDMFFDGGIISYRLGYIEGIHSGPKTGGNHQFIGRFSIPLIIATFISFVSATVGYRSGVEDYVSHGITASGLSMVPLYMIGFIIIKQFLNVPFIWLTIKYGAFAERTSYLFIPTTAEEFQLGEVTKSYKKQDRLGRIVRQREEIINGLKKAIENNEPYSPYDEYRKDKRFSIKTLEKEDKDAYV